MRAKYKQQTLTTIKSNQQTTQDAASNKKKTNMYI